MWEAADLEERNGAHEEAGLRQEVGVEDGDELRLDVGVHLLRPKVQPGCWIGSWPSLSNEPEPDPAPVPRTSCIAPAL